jgi:hypothetical protein
MAQKEVDPEKQAEKDRKDAARTKQISEAVERRPPPHLISSGNLKHCSVCGHPFQPDVKPSMSVAFADHLRKAHQLGQTSEGSNRSAVRKD